MTGDGETASGLNSQSVAYLLTWNPDRWHWRDYAGYVRAVADGSAEPMMWSVGNRQHLPAGSRLFLVRVGSEPKGVIGSGVAVDDIHEELHRDPARAAKGEMAPRTTIRFDHLLDAEVSSPLDAGRSGVASLEAFNWAPQSSGVEIPADVAADLEEKWRQHVHGHSPMRALPVPVSLAELSSVLIRVGEAGSVFRPSQDSESTPRGSGSGGSRRSSSAKLIGDRAELLVKEHLQTTLPTGLRSTIRHHAAEGETPGYDLSYGDGDSLIAVEVKGSVQAGVTSIELTANEWQAAKDLGQRYHLYIVGNATSDRPVIEVVTHAAARLEVTPTVYRARVSADGG